MLVIDSVSMLNLKIEVMTVQSVNLTLLAVEMLTENTRLLGNYANASHSYQFDSGSRAWCYNVALRLRPNARSTRNYCTTFPTIALIAMKSYFQLVFPDFNCCTISKLGSALLSERPFTKARLWPQFIENIAADFATIPAAQSFIKFILIGRCI